MRIDEAHMLIFARADDAASARSPGSTPGGGVRGQEDSIK
jgi:hypothetical protein